MGLGRATERLDRKNGKGGIFANGSVATCDYDIMNRVTNITCRTASGARLGGFAYRYDALDCHVYDDDWQVIADLDESGNVVARWTYDAWGNVLTEEIAESAVELRAVRYRFQGREWSAATGLTNFRMRWYDPVTGRWLSKDPIRLSGGLNLYAFCNGQPLRFRDFNGLCGDDSDISYWDRYFEYTSGLMINPIVVIGEPFFGVMPKSWAPSTGGRPPALGSKNPWTSIPRGFGFDKGSARDVFRSSSYRATASLVGGGILAAGAWNFGVTRGTYRCGIFGLTHNS